MARSQIFFQNPWREVLLVVACCPFLLWGERGVVILGWRVSLAAETDGKYFTLFSGSPLALLDVPPDVDGDLDRQIHSPQLSLQQSENPPGARVGAPLVLGPHNPYPKPPGPPYLLRCVCGEGCTLSWLAVRPASAPPLTVVAHWTVAEGQPGDTAWPATFWNVYMVWYSWWEVGVDPPPNQGYRLNGVM